MADATPGEQPVNEGGADTGEGAPPTAGKRKRLLLVLLAVVAVILVIYGIWYFLTQAGRVSTDNAYVGADMAQVTALVGGPVAEVRVSGTQEVKKGDVLVVLDDDDAQIALATAQAGLKQAQQRYRQSTAGVGSAKAMAQSRAAEIAQAHAKLAEAEAAYQRTRIEYQRRQALVSSGAVSGEELTSAKAAFDTANAARAQGRAAIAAAEANRTSASSEVNSAEALVVGTTETTAPDVASAQAKVDKARLDLKRTVIRAPVDGVITNRQVQVGQMIQPSVTIMTIVPVANSYVDANFKESQFRRIRVNQPAELTSDFYGSGVVYHGRVIGFAGGTGAAFALIPAQNATGNWVKVVQRLPVRIMLDRTELRDHPLRVGLSMTATVDTRGH